MTELLKNEPMPDLTQRGRRKTRWPEVRRMEVGDCVKTTWAKGDSLRAAALHYSRSTGWKFITEWNKNADTFKIWRTA